MRNWLYEDGLKSQVAENLSGWKVHIIISYLMLIFFLPNFTTATPMEEKWVYSKIKLLWSHFMWVYWSAYELFSLSFSLLLSLNHRNKNLIFCWMVRPGLVSNNTQPHCLAFSQRVWLGSLQGNHTVVLVWLQLERIPVSFYRGDQISIWSLAYQ